ncbi:MAG: CYTH domain-containing protein [Calditrichia bacterium]
MGKEIERKFLVKGEDWRKMGKPMRYVQGYLSCEKERTVRVRLTEEKAFITIKGMATASVRHEFEYEIPPEDAEIMLKEMCEKPLIEKNRFIISYGGLVWEVDEFFGMNRGLITAEVELQDENQSIDLPPWIEREVTGDPRYLNVNLVKNPYSTW